MDGLVGEGERLCLSYHIITGLIFRGNAVGAHPNMPSSIDIGRLGELRVGSAFNRYSRN